MQLWRFFRREWVAARHSCEWVAARHSRESGNPGIFRRPQMDSRLRGNDGMKIDLFLLHVIVRSLDRANSAKHLLIKTLQRHIPIGVRNPEFSNGRAVGSVLEKLK